MKNSFIIAVGSSAGGLKAMQSFFDHTPHDGATYIILRHIPLAHQSKLDQILKRHSKLSFREAVNDETVENDKVYLPPSSMHLTIKNDRLYLHPRINENLFPNRIVNIFLESLALYKGNRSIAVILSGGGSDGSIGAAAIKNAGGLVLAQTPSSCEHCSMPENAIKSGAVDHILLPSEMPEVIASHIKEIVVNSQ